VTAARSAGFEGNIGQNSTEGYRERIGKEIARMNNRPFEEETAKTQLGNCSHEITGEATRGLRKGAGYRCHFMPGKMIGKYALTWPCWSRGLSERKQA